MELFKKQTFLLEDGLFWPFFAMRFLMGRMLVLASCMPSESIVLGLNAQS